MLAKLALLFAISLALTDARRPLQPPYLELDLGGSAKRCREMAQHLLSNDPAEWHEAQIRLAHAGPAALAAIDEPRLLEDPRGLERVRDLVTMALGRAITPRDLEARPRLDRLVTNGVAKGLALAPVLAKMDKFMGRDAYDTMFPQPVRVPPPPPRLQEQVFALGGLAVPAALLLLHDPRPVGRAWGIEILARLNAAAVVDSVAPLAGDAAEFIAWHSDFATRETVASGAKSFLNNISGTPQYRCFIYEEPIEDGAFNDLVNGIRETSNAMKATTWDQWWDEARPTWQEWWRLAGNGPHPPDRGAWLKVVEVLKSRGR